MIARFKRPARAIEPRLLAYLEIEFVPGDCGNILTGQALRGFEIWRGVGTDALTVVYPHKRQETKPDGWLFLRPPGGAPGIATAALTTWILAEYRRWERALSAGIRGA
jgi:hypothetical protein